MLGPDIGGRSCCSLRCAAGGPVSGALPAAASNSSRSVCRPPCVAALHKSQGCSEAWVGGHIAPYCRVTAIADSVIDCIAERALVCTVGGSGRPAEDAWFSDARKPTRFAGGASIIVLFVTTRLNVCHHFYRLVLAGSGRCCRTLGVMVAPLVLASLLDPKPIVRACTGTILAIAWAVVQDPTAIASGISRLHVVSHQGRRRGSFIHMPHCFA